METSDEARLVKWMKLGRVRGLGPKKILQLVEIFGSLEAIFDAAPNELTASLVFKEHMLADWRQLKEASDENFIRVVRECVANSIKIVTLLDNEYPIKLKRIPSPPMTLFLLGNSSLLTNTRKIAVVGTREPSENARTLAFDFSKYFSDLGITIVSGGAEGIDTAAHEGALVSNFGKTICVLGTGFFKPYPPSNRPLFERIKTAGGLLVSEHLPNFPGSNISLVQRNRITSGLSDALLVCASRKTGGSMVQTRIAWEQRIPIFCPSLSFDLQPNDGIKIVINKFGAREITIPQELLAGIQRSPAMLQQQL